MGDTDSASTWFGIAGGARDSDAGNAGDGNADAGGEAGNAGAGNDGVGNGNGGGGPPGPPDPPPSDHGGAAGGRRASRCQRRMKESEFATSIQLKEPKPFEGKPWEDFDTWWVLVQVYIEDQPEKIPKDQRTINWIGSLTDKYAAAWHIQWLEGTLNGVHPQSMMGYVNASILCFKDRDPKDEAYPDLEKVRYEGWISDMFTRIQMYHEEAMVMEAAFKKLILEQLPIQILVQMHMIDLTGKTDSELISMITNAG